MAEPEAEIDALFELNKKKKKKSTKAKTEAVEEVAAKVEDNGKADVDSSSSAAVVSTEADIGIPNYTYTQLLERVVDFVQQNNPELAADGRRFKMKPPQLMRGKTLQRLIITVE